MKTKILSTVLILFITIDLFSQTVGDAFPLNINSIYLPINRSGVLASVNIPPIGPGGQFGEHVFLFSGGFFLSGYSNGTLWANAVAPASLVEDYLPGTYSNDALLYRLSSDDPPFISASWQTWQSAVYHGADFYDGNGDGLYTPVDLNGNGRWDLDEDRPDILGDETIWCVYHDGRPSSQRRWNVEPQGIEIRQTIFAYDTIPELQNIIFIRYRIENTGMVANEMTDVYFSVWDDPDLGDSQDDLVGCDTLLKGGFTYNDGPDTQYGNNPPSFFATILAGPVTYIPGVTFIDNNSNGTYEGGIDTPLDTAYIHRGQILSVEVYPGATNQNISSMVHYINGDPNLNDPVNKEEARNYMLGLTKNGNLIDPCNWNYGQVLGGVDCSQVNPMFWYSGDPFTNFGWINKTPKDQRQMQNIGPFTLRAGDEYEVFVAYNVGQGNDALSSVTEVKDISTIARLLYSSNFDTSTVVPVKEILSNIIPDSYSLYQNYPNPFNPSTVINYQLPVSGDVSLKVFDVLGNELATLFDEYKHAGTYEVEWDATGFPSGVYFYQLEAGSFMETKKMIFMK